MRSGEPVRFHSRSRLTGLCIFRMNEEGRVYVLWRENWRSSSPGRYYTGGQKLIRYVQDLWCCMYLQLRSCSLVYMLALLQVEMW